MSWIMRKQFLVAAGAMFAAQLVCAQQTQRPAAKVPTATAPQAAQVPAREKIATQKLMRNPWEKQRTAVRSQ